MQLRWIRRSASFVRAWTAVACIAGCGKPTKPSPDAVNDTPPNANARIESQTSFGSQQQYSSAYFIRLADDGSLATLGLYNSSRGVGVLDAGGAVRWFQPLSYEPREVGPLAGTAIVPHGLLVTGLHDVDGDGHYEGGDASLYSSTGALLSQIPVASDSSAVTILGFASVEDSTFIACGGEQRSGIDHPVLTILHLKAPGLLERGRTVTLQGLTGHFGRVLTLPSSSTDVALAATLVNGNSRSICRLRAAWPSFDPVTVEWSHEISSPHGSWVTLPGLAQSGDNLYVAGTANDNRKAAAASGRARTSGLAASYSSAGDERWLTIVSLTQHSESFYGLTIGPDAVYAVGHGAEYAAENNAFGYGLVSKLDFATGQAGTSLIVGDDHFLSGFYSVVWTAHGLVCGGLTQLEFSNGVPILPEELPNNSNSWRQGWITTLDLSGTSALRNRSAAN